MTNYCIFLPIHLLKCPSRVVKLSGAACPLTLLGWSACGARYILHVRTPSKSHNTPLHCNSKSITNNNYYYHHISQVLHAL